MHILLQLLAFIITILVLVSIHEAGHFLVAKWLGIKVIRFSIGFGKPIIRFRDKKDTEYVLALIPLGGYVKLLDEREVVVPESEKHLTFNSQPLWARTSVILAGPLTNILFAIFSFWIMFMVGIYSYRPIVEGIHPASIAAKAGLKRGDLITQVDGRSIPNVQKFMMAVVERLGEKTEMIIDATNIYSHNKYRYHLDLESWTIHNLNPQPLLSLGIKLLQPSSPPIIQEVSSRSPASQAGLKSFDKILAINNQPIDKWSQFVIYTRSHPGEKIALTYQRGHLIRNTSVIIGSKWGKGFVGVKPISLNIPPHLLMLRQYPLLQAFSVAVGETWQLFAFNFIIIKKIIVGQISLGSLGGPITIFQSADIAFQQGVGVFFGFLALLSIMLGFINVLPIPGLDGGHLLNNLIEFIIRRPLSLKFEVITIQIGMVILVLIMFLATFNDILRLLIALQQ